MNRLALFLCVVSPAIIGSTGTASGAETKGRHAERLRAIYAEYWTDLLLRHPLEATIFVGDHRFDDRLGDPSVASYAAWLGRLRATRETLNEVESTGLSDDERLDRKILLSMIDDRLGAEKFGDHLIPLVQLTRYASDLHFPDQHLLFSQLGEYQPASTIGDLENYLRRLRAFPLLADQLIEVMRRGLAAGRTPPRLVMARVAIQLRSLGKPKAEESPLWAIVARMPADWTAADCSAMTERVRTAIATEVAPAYDRLADFVEKEYLPACRESIGLCDTPDGSAHYAHLVRTYTTTDLTPDQIHDLGLREMAKARAGMEAIRRRVGFEGDLKAFLVHTRANPALRNRSERQILDRHRAILDEMEANLPKLFRRLPRIPFEVRAFEPIRAKASPSGEYYPPPSDGSRPGIFYVNTTEPTTRPTYTMQALAYHEAVPGHHLQQALAVEAQGRPPFRRYFYIPAFDEGWALYSEGLAVELGLYADPFAEFGRLNYDAWRCARLVVDTGIHDRRWSRERALAYMEENTSLPRDEIEFEVDRYIAWPGQALAYKIGELKIREIRTKAERRDGNSFDIKAFHDRLLSFGSVPLSVLEDRMHQESPK